MENANSHPLKVEMVEEEGMKANSHPYKVEVVAGDNVATKDWVDDRIRGTFVEVDELPERGEEGVTYYLRKEGEDTFDLYRWLNEGWVKIDTDIKLYSSTGDNSDGAMTQEATTEATKFATGEAVSSLNIASALGGGTNALVPQRYIPRYTARGSQISYGSGGKGFGISLRNGGGANPDQGSYTNFYLAIDESEGLNIAAKGDSAWQIRGLAVRGATSSVDGVQGMVPKPVAGDEGKYLKGDGTWGEVSGATVITDNEYNSLWENA